MEERKDLIGKIEEVRRKGKDRLRREGKIGNRRKGKKMGLRE